ncbi:hypothetical protein LCGC14_1369870 [marine sediment metagenome]|uniref:S-methyl-5-thioribose-1-phosphate isomerase n=1 Tax=marine sediment metagenome TaxID=412755 RepID=A0A0F9KRL5_9ZZZZ
MEFILSNLNTMMTPIIWKNDQLHLLDQRELPRSETWLEYDDAYAVADAIQTMVVRGAPAIGVTAAYGVVIAATNMWKEHTTEWQQHMDEPLTALANARPTAVNLFWAINRMKAVLNTLPSRISPKAALLEEAVLIHQQDIEANQQMGKYGSSLLAEQSHVLTHCNAGALATGGFGTALGVIRQGFIDGKIAHVFVDETRPWLQGSRLTAWELMKEEIPMTLQADVAAGALMASGQLDWIIVGADRIAANGDTANKIGTYSLAVLAKYHGVKVMVVAPCSTIDWSISDGTNIPIEQRHSFEVSSLNGVSIAPDNVAVSNPAFDVTPAALIDAIVTEAGVVMKPSTKTMNAIRLKEML